MLRFSDLNFRPHDRTLRQFAAAWLLVLGGMGAWKGSAALIVIGVVIGVIGLIAPKAIRPIYAGATLLAFPLGWVMSRVLFAALYYVVMTPIGLVMRLASRDRLARRRGSEQGRSYWTERIQSDDPVSYFRQF